jgi:hypothetical protein
MKVTSGTLSNGTVAIAANPDRLGLIVSNNSDTVMTYSPDATASAAVGISVPAGQAIVLIGPAAQALIKNAGTVFCAGASKAYSIYEW